MLKLEKVVKTYHHHTALKGLTCSISRGQVVGLLGANGAGKSTTMNIIAGYLAPTSGRVMWDGVDVRRLGPAYQCEVGYLPEVPPLHPELTVRESMEYACGLKRIRRHKKAAHIEKLCDLCGVADRMNMTTRSLSKGYKQRVGLAQALIGNPGLIILDEPTAGLDPGQIVSIRELIRELGREHAVILSSHILSEIDDVCSTLLILRRGEMVASGTIAQIAASVRSDGHRLKVRTSGEGAMQALCDIDGVTQVLPLAQREAGWQEWEVCSSSDVARRVPEALRAAGADMRMLYPMDVELEDLFMKLMRRRAEEC